VIGNGLNNMVNPLETMSLVGPTNVALTGGGAAYARFRVSAGVTSTIISTSGTGAVPANVVMILVRTL